MKQMYFQFPPQWRLRVMLLFTLALSSAFIPLIMGPGLSTPDPIQPYLNGAFPAAQSNSTSAGFTSYASNLSFNTTMNVVQAPRSSLLYVIERNGKIFSFDKTSSSPVKTLFRDMENQVWNGQDSGLLGLAFHPDFNEAGSPNKNFLYIFYVTESGGVRYIRVSRLTKEETSETYAANSEQILINQRLDFTSSNLHRGGALVFGDDGFLYISIGDLGSMTQSQNIEDRLLGGVLRIDVDKHGGSISHPIRRSLQQLNQGTSDNYYIPSDNPWLDINGGLFEEYYAIGCRSPHKMSKDIATGSIYIGNVGSNSGNKKEEINELSKGANFGWPFREGATDRPDLMPRPSTIIGTLTDPLFFYQHGSGNNCIIGGYVYRGSNYPSLDGKYIFGDFGSRNVWSINLDGSGQQLLSSLGGQFPTFAQDNDGEIYIGQMGNNPLLQLTVVEQRDIPDGVYYLRSRHSGLVLDVQAFSTSNGGNIYQWTKNNTANQQWNIEKLTDGSYRIMSQHSSLFMEASAFGTANGTNVQQWTWTGTNSQKWAIEQGPDGYFFIRNLHNNKYVDVAAYSTSNGGNIHLWSKHGGNNQQWELIAVNGPAVTPPKYLSETGAFTDLVNLIPTQGVIPYTVNTSLWSDGSDKLRWVAIPNDGTFDSPTEQVELDHLDEWDFVETRGEWKFPPGTVFIKHFELALDENNPAVTRKLETRFVILLDNEQFYGLTYKWNSAGTDAELLYDSANDTFTITETGGNTRTQIWHYPSRSECLTCHTQASGGVLGPQTSQLSGDLLYPTTGIIANQLETWDHLNIFDQNLDINAINKFITSRDIDDQSASLEQRVRSYLDANCSSCHRPDGGPRAEFDARIETGLDAQNLINGPVIEDLGIPNARLIVPGNPQASIIYQRVNQANTPDAMPPLAKSRVHEEGADLIKDWINALPSNGGGLTATYFSDQSLTTAAFTRTDRAIDFNWDVNPPQDGFTRTNFSVRWEGTLETRFAEMYTFSLMADDGVRMWVNGQQIINDWNIQAPSETSGQIQLSQGVHQVKIEYFQASGHARVHLFWESPSQSRELVPAMYTQPNSTGTPQGGLQATYYDNSNFTGNSITRVDPTINFNWGTGSPDPQIANDTYSARWEGTVEAPTSGTYTFYTTTDDGVRLWVNNQLIIDKWIVQAPREWSGAINMLAGQKVSIKMEYYENFGGAVAQLAWSGPSVAKQIIPSVNLSPRIPVHQGGLQATYFDNSDFTGSSISRIDTVINFNWKASSPDPQIGDNTFSARWEGYIEAPSSGTYRFYTTTDDGVRLWVDDQLIVNKWIVQNPKKWSGTINLVAGQKVPIKMEYFDDTGDARAKLAWSGPGISQQIVPSAYLSTASARLARQEQSSILEGSSLSIYPNPTRNQPTIFINWSTPAKGEVFISLTNIQGQEVYRSSYQAIEGDNRWKLPVYQLSQGIYYLNLTQENERFTKRILVN